MLLCGDYRGLVIHNAIRGIEVVEENEHEVYVRAYSGENWHQLVLYCIERGWAGIENLSLIPGTVGAAPIQNIGAYGVELMHVFQQLEALNLHTMELETFSLEQCAFAYRESVFKRKLKGQYFIYSVTLKLSKQYRPNISYGDIRAVLEQQGINPEFASIRQVSDAVIGIRRSKLPDPAVLGNSGSFFKNPVIPSAQFLELKLRFPDMKGFEQSGEAGIKVPSAWLIEQCGWKGKQVGHTGAHKTQPLVLVNYGGATGSEIRQLAMDIMASVYEKFGIRLEPEVNIIAGDG